LNKIPSSLVISANEDFAYMIAFQTRYRFIDDKNHTIYPKEVLFSYEEFSYEDKKYDGVFWDENNKMILMEGV
jgi:hypothetical protein